MKLLQMILIAFLLGMTIPAFANDQDAQADLLLAKISTALNNDRMSVALSACAQLEKLGPSLSKPLPEIFYFNYIETMHRIGAKENILNRAYAYLEKYGKAGPHYQQVTAIVREQQMAAVRAGKVDADAAVIAWNEANRLQEAQEHEQALVLLRACQSEAIALEATERELNVAYEEITAQSAALLAAKAALDTRVLLINRAGSGTPEEQAQSRVNFNRDSQAYNDAVDTFLRAKDLYAGRVEGYDHRFKSYGERCGNLLFAESELEEVCGQSEDWFCRNIE